MQRRILGHSGIETSGIGLGALHFGVFLDEQQSARMVHEAMDHGIDFFDTAPIYGSGRSEDLLGKALKGRRDKAIITSKVGLAPRTLADGSFGVEVVALTPQTIREGVERSLTEIGTDYLDLFQLHAFDHDNPVEETYACLDELVKEGKLRAYGCSNYDPAETEAMMAACAAQGIAPAATSQCHLNLIERKVLDHLAPLCEQTDTGIICNRALARGILTGKYKAGAEPPKGSRGEGSWRVRKWLKDETLDLVAALAEWAGGRGRTVSELSVAWLLAQPVVSVVLIGVRDSEQLSGTAAGGDWVLSQQDLAEIDGLIEAHGQTDAVRALPEVYFEK